MVAPSLVLLALTSAAAPGASPVPPFPANAVILESRALPEPAGRTRRVVLWMIAPTREPRPDPDEPYTCPEETRGSSWTGPTRVSLVDNESGRVLDTIAIRDDNYPEDDSMTLPYLIHPDSYYLVEHVTAHGDGPPTILAFRDINGDGLPYEFALFDALACMGLGTTLVGYSAQGDRLLQYPVNLLVTTAGGSSTESHLWADYLFSERPAAPGAWRYAIDYRGRGGCLDSYDVRYDAATKTFAGTLVESDCSE